MGIQHPDAKLKRQVCSCLAQIAKHSVDLAEVVVEAEIFPNILNCLKDNDTFVRKNAATCIREVAKHTPELAKLIVNAGGAAALVDYVSEVQGNAKLPGIMAIGYIAAFSETLALAVIVSKGVAPLRDALTSEPGSHQGCQCLVSWPDWPSHTGPRALISRGRCAAPPACLHDTPGQFSGSADQGKARPQGRARQVHPSAGSPAAAQGCADQGAEVRAQAVRCDAPQRLGGSPRFRSERWPAVPAGARRDSGWQAQRVYPADQQLLPPEIVEYYSPNYSKT